MRRQRRRPPLPRRSMGRLLAMADEQTQERPADQGEPEKPKKKPPAKKSTTKKAT